MGGSLVAVNGSNFVASDHLRCRFGTTAVAATYVTASSVRCRTPAAAAGAVNVYVANNGVDYTTDTLSYTYQRTSLSTFVYIVIVLFNAHGCRSGCGCDVVLACCGPIQRLTVVTITKSLVAGATCRVDSIDVTAATTVSSTQYCVCLYRTLSVRRSGGVCQQSDYTI